MKFLGLGFFFLFILGCRESGEGEINKEVKEVEREWVLPRYEDWEELGFGGEGAAAWTGGVLRMDVGVELTGGKFVGVVPEVPYELELEARKVSGEDFFCGLTFPVRSRDECVTLIVGGWGGGTVGISSIGGRDASQNETTSYRDFEKGTWYRVRVVVEKERLRSFLGDEKVVDVDLRGKVLSLREGSIELCAPLGVAAWQTGAEVRKMRWRSLVD